MHNCSLSVQTSRREATSARLPARCSIIAVCESDLQVVCVRKSAFCCQTCNDGFLAGGLLKACLCNGLTSITNCMKPVHMHHYYGNAHLLTGNRYWCTAEVHITQPQHCHSLAYCMAAPVLFSGIYITTLQRLCQFDAQSTVCLRKLDKAWRAAGKHKTRLLQMHYSIKCIHGGALSKTSIT